MGSGLDGKVRSNLGGLSERGDTIFRLCSMSFPSIGSYELLGECAGVSWVCFPFSLSSGCRAVFGELAVMILIRYIVNIEDETVVKRISRVAY